MSPQANGSTTHNTPVFKGSLLHVSGTSIVDAFGTPVVLKGAALGGYLNMENFITGYSGHEHEHRAQMSAVLGPEKAQFFFDRLIHYSFTEGDAAFFASLGLNCLRLPFNYRHFIDDTDPTVIKKSGFALLDRIVNICRQFNLYVILDLHAVPGGQNQDWHSDSGLTRALFWDFKVFQDQMVNLWVEIAKHYAGDPVIAGYNPLNEPADPEHTRLISWYERVERAIRAVDPDHILFMDGNTYAMDFSQFTTVLPNAVYACHDYAKMGFPGQEVYVGTDEQKAKLRRQFERKVQFMRERGVPIWNGEFGPVYPDAREEDSEATNEARLGVLREQLRIYAETDISWSIWLYKDIGYQGMVYVDPESPYMKLIAPFVAKKQRLGLDFWGCTDKKAVKDVYEPFLQGLRDMVGPELLQKKYPPVWTFDRQVERAVRECLLSEYLGWEFAELFRGKTEQEIEDLARSFAFENCVKRTGLNRVLQEDAGLLKR
ncbi:endoglucanase C [Aspergillus udagawae]|nr:endoglucanase C [Aspergillus udagawae]